MDAPADRQLSRLASRLETPDEAAVSWADATTTRTHLAAVAAMLRPTPDATDLELLLIRRAERADDAWSGHVALPGGRADRDDASLLGTAIRETREEVAVDLRAPGAQLLGALPVLGPRRPGLPRIEIHPFVWTVGDVTCVPNDDEVAAVQWVTLAHLRHAEHRTEFRHAAPDGAEHRFPGVDLGEDVLWGLTHDIVETLLDACGTPD